MTGSGTGGASRRTVLKRTLWVIGLSVSAILGVALTGFVGLVNSASLIMAPPGTALPGDLSQDAAPRHDAGKPTVAVLLGDTRTEAADFLAPYATFAESGAYNVYAVAASRATRTLAGGIDVVPQLTFAELAARAPHGPDVIVVPAISHINSPENAAIVDWLRASSEGRTLFAWCAGAEVLAASGVIDGRPATTHWARIDGFEGTYPASMLMPLAA